MNEVSNFGETKSHHQKLRTTVRVDREFRCIDPQARAANALSSNNLG
jgi:hypothetical protein